jgi:hypothetical protein
MNPTLPINCSQVYNFRPANNENSYISPISDRVVRVSARLIEKRQTGFSAGSDENITRPLSNSNVRSWESSVESVEHLPFEMD